MTLIEEYKKEIDAIGKYLPDASFICETAVIRKQAETTMLIGAAVQWLARRKIDSELNVKYSARKLGLTTMQRRWPKGLKFYLEEVREHMT